MKVEDYDKMKKKKSKRHELTGSVAHHCCMVEISMKNPDTINCRGMIEPLNSMRLVCTELQGKHATYAKPKLQ